MKKSSIIIALLSVLLFGAIGVLIWVSAPPLNGTPPQIQLPPAPAPQVQNLQAQNPPAPNLAANVQEIITQLGAPNAAARAQAQLVLEKIGQPALALLQQSALNNPDPEVRARCKELIQTIGGNEALAALNPNPTPVAQPQAQPPAVQPQFNFAPPVAAPNMQGAIDQQRMLNEAKQARLLAEKAKELKQLKKDNEDLDRQLRAARTAQRGQNSGPSVPQVNVPQIHIPQVNIPNAGAAQSDMQQIDQLRRQNEEKQRQLRNLRR